MDTPVHITADWIADKTKEWRLLTHVTTNCLLAWERASVPERLCAYKRIELSPLARREGILLKKYKRDDLIRLLAEVPDLGKKEWPPCALLGT